jgi:hypothetical protein
VKATKMTLFCKRINDDLVNAWAPQPATATKELPHGPVTCDSGTHLG